jgi:hypothetical protein
MGRRGRTRGRRLLLRSECGPTEEVGEHGEAAGPIAGLTVEVMSDEHTSQTYLMPPSVPRVPVFFLMTPMAKACTYGGRGRKADRGSRIADRRQDRRGETSRLYLGGWLC